MKDSHSGKAAQSGGFRLASGRSLQEQHVHAVEQLDAGAYGYLVSRTALLHPKGETFDVSMGLRGFFEALTKIAAPAREELWGDGATAAAQAWAAHSSCWKGIAILARA